MLAKNIVNNYWKASCRPCLLAFALFLGGLSALAKASSKQQLDQEFESLLKKSGISRSKLALAVSPVWPSPLKEPAFALNEHQKMTPASLSKIITAGAALEYLKPFHQFETSFLSEGAVEDGVLKGPLYLKGGGDPSFVSESLWQLVNHLTRHPVRRVEGGLILDDFLFEKPKKNWKKDRSRSFNTPLSALSFNWNSVNIYIQSSNTEKKAPLIFIDPQNSYVRFENKLQTKGLEKNINISRKKGQDHFVIRGSVPKGAGEILIHRNISKPILWTGHNVLEFLKQRGIQVLGPIERGKTPPAARLLASHKGRTVSRLVQDMMKFSNNFIADVLTAHLSILPPIEKPRGSLEAGVQKIHHYLKKRSIKNFIFEQPSGLSHKNKLTASGLLTVLLQDLKSPYSFETLAGYSLAGGDGSLRNRFKNLKPSSFIRAKTGQLAGVVGLAGYVLSSKQGLRAFVFIYNGSAKKQFQAIKLFDELALALAE